LVSYKWVALSNTTIGILMASINGTITLISLPAIFRGIHINPLDSFQYLLWILMGYNIVTSSFLVTFGRLSDIFGRVRLYNLGFAIFTVGSIMLYLTPNTGDLGALELIVFRLVQAVGGAFLFANSAAIITDAFPINERGKALGINQVAGLAGSLIGLVLGGVLATSNWRYVFLVSVPVGILGSVWSYLKLREVGVTNRNQRVDWAGNATFAAGLTLLLIGVTYGLMPYGGSEMGWGDPYVIAALTVGAALLVAFPFVEGVVPDPMFRMELFKIKAFSMGNLASFLRSVGFGGVQIMLVILLQGIWLPLHGYDYSVTPFWAGVYLLPLSVGFVASGPLSGWLSDRYGARAFATLGMVLVGSTFLGLSSLSYDFSYLPFAFILFLMGVGGGLFASPNTALIMNSVPKYHRGAASGMRATIQNVGQTASLAIFFTLMIVALAATLPSAMQNAVLSAGAPQQLAYAMGRIPVTGALFSAFLGYNPVASILNTLPPQISSQIPQSTIVTLTSKYWFPHAIAPSFMSALRLTFYIGAALSFIAALASVAAGGKAQAEEIRVEAKEVERGSVRSDG